MAGGKKYPGVSSEHPVNVKIYTGTQNVVHAFFVHLNPLSLRYTGTLLHLVPGRVGSIGSQGCKTSASRNGGLHLQGGLGKDSRRTDPPCHRHLLFRTYLLRVRAFSHIPSPSVDSDRKSAVRVFPSPPFTKLQFTCFGAVIVLQSRLLSHWSRLQLVATSKQQRIPAPRHRIESLHDTSAYLHLC